MSETHFTSIDMLAKLVAFDTTSRNSNLPLIEFVQNYLEGFGIDSILIDYEAGKKTNLYATIGPDKAGGIVLSGHTDVVPVDGQDWSSDPFRLEERDGLLYGRGSADMKGFIAVILAMVPQFLAKPLKTPVHFAFSCDEEVGCNGVRPMIDHIKQHLPKPSAVLVGEPTSMRVVNAHKSATRFETVVNGHEAHSSCSHLGVNAILTAGQLLGEIGRMSEEYQAIGDVSGRFDPGYTSFNIGEIKGGTAGNIIPGRCAFDWETRTLPEHKTADIKARFNRFADSLTPKMKAVSPDAGIETIEVNSIPSLMPETDSPAEILAMHLAQANGSEAVSYGTEAGLFQQAGMPAVVCGPGNIEQAHKSDEFVAISELDKCETFIQRLIDHCKA